MAKSIWLARHAKQTTLKTRLLAVGIQPIVFSPLTLQPLPAEDVLGELQSLLPVDRVIVVSPAAVQFANQLSSGLSKWIPLATPCFAPGPVSASAMESLGYTNNHFPQIEQNSEGLLNLPELSQVAGQHWLIIGGESGRPLLADTLRQRGAEVSYLACYQRCAVTDWSPLVNACPDLALFSSADALRAAFNRPEAAFLRSLPLVVTSERIAAVAEEYRHAGRCEISGGRDDDALIKAIELAVA